MSSQKDPTYLPPITVPRAKRPDATLNIAIVRITPEKLSVASGRFARGTVIGDLGLQNYEASRRQVRAALVKSYPALAGSCTNPFKFLDDTFNAKYPALSFTSK